MRVDRTTWRARPGAPASSTISNEPVGDDRFQRSSLPLNAWLFNAVAIRQPHDFRGVGSGS
eukprot:9099944-Lingulodinium_polyedra.AAC.1